MAPKKGNKHGVGYGRPTNPGFSDPEVIILGEELLKWCAEQDDNEDSNIVHLSEWYSEIKGIAPSQWESLAQRPCFLAYYEKAIKWMGKRILKNNQMASAYGSRFLGIYFREVREHEREIVEHKVDYEIKKKQEIGKEGYSLDQVNDANLALIRAQGIIAAQAEQLKEKDKIIDELKPKADPIVQPSEQTV